MDGGGADDGDGGRGGGGDDCDDEGRAGVVDIATRYGLDGPGIESHWGRYFPHPSLPALRPTQPLIK